ncbi:hypothetical protein SPHINGOT1_70096 [Sphingomonas sp. T1]|nr:hypothetical protein SPHINGOT1_70096 [Sphingomonas sp. T1]
MATSHGRARQISQSAEMKIMGPCAPCSVDQLTVASRLTVGRMRHANPIRSGHHRAVQRARPLPTSVHDPLGCGRASTRITHFSRRLMSGKASVFYPIFKAIATIAENAIARTIDRPPVSPRDKARPYRPYQAARAHAPKPRFPAAWGPAPRRA